MLASRGHPTLSLAYFGAPGLPQGLQDIPVEYFATAAALLPGPVVVIGASRGTEAALLLAGLYPELVSGVVLAAPNSQIIGAFPVPGNAWTVDGQPRTELPLDTVAAPVLALAGTDDGVWPMVGNSAVAHVRFLEDALGPLVETVLVQGAGHDILGVPYVSWDPVLTHPVTGQSLDLGGTRLGNEQARRQTWAALLAFLDRVEA